MTDKFSAALRDGEIRGSRGVELMVDAGEMGMHQSSSLSVPLLRFCSRRVGGGIHGRALTRLVRLCVLRYVILFRFWSRGCGLLGDGSHGRGVSSGGLSDFYGGGADSDESDGGVRIGVAGRLFWR
jgi:hypothetical protein